MKKVPRDTVMRVLPASPRPAGRGEAGSSSRRWRRARRVLTPWLFLLPAAVILGTFTYYPLWRSIQLSFTKWNLLSDPQPVGWDNYALLADSSEFRATIFVTVVFTGGNLVGTYLLAFASALLLRQTFRGVKLVRSSILIPTVIPMVVAGLTWRWMLEPSTGLIDQGLGALGLFQPNWLFDPQLALLSVVAVSIWRDFGIYMLVLLGGLLAIPKEITEAADLDGASGWQRLFRVTMPMIAAANAFVIVLVLFNSIKAFDQIWVMTQGGPGGATTTILTYVFNKISSGQVGLAAAASVILFLVVFILVIARATLERNQNAGINVAR